MSTTEALNFVLGGVSLALGIVAMWQAMHFYDKGKATETAVATALAEIKAQTAALERLAGRQLDRFTKAATQARAPEESLLSVARALAEIAPQVSQPTPSTPTSDVTALREEVVICYINTLYLAGLANMVLVSALKEMGPPDDGYAEVSALTEQTFVHFRHMQNVLSKVAASEIQASANAELYKETMADIAPNVANTAMVVQQRNAGA